MGLINYINTGSSANAGDGDSLRTAFTKINLNFDALVSSFVAAGVTSWNGRVGIVNFTNTDLLNILGYTPYPDSNPEGFVTSSTIALSNYAPLSYVNTSFVFVSDLSAYNFASVSYVDLKLTEYPTLAYLEQQQYLTSISLPDFLTNYVTDGEQAAFGVDLRSYTDNAVFQAVRNNSLIPVVADNYNLGAEDYRWSTLYLSNAVYIQGIGISTDPITGKILIDGNSPTGPFNFSAGEIVNGDNATFTISASPTSANKAGIILPSDSDVATPLTLSNENSGGVLITGTGTNVTVDNLGQLGLNIDTKIISPLKIGGTPFVYNGNTYRDQYIEILPNEWYGSQGTDIPSYQKITSYETTSTHAPIAIRGSRVVLYAFTLSDAVSFVDQLPAYIALDESGFYVGNNFVRGNGEPSSDSDAFEGYRLPLTRGKVGQVLTVISTSTLQQQTLSIVDWAYPTGGGTGSNLLAVSSNITPATNNSYDLGSAGNAWRTLYVSSSTIHVGGRSIRFEATDIVIDGQPLQDPTANFTNTNSIADYINSGTGIYSYLLPGGTTASVILNYSLPLTTSTGVAVKNIKFADGSIQSTAFTGSTLVNGTYTVSLASTGPLNLPTSTAGSARIQSPADIDILSGSKLYTFGNDGEFTVPGHIIPDTNVAYDLGSPTFKFRDLYLSTTTLYLGTSTLSVSTQGQMLVNGNAATAKLEYFGGEGYGPRDAAWIKWNTSTITFNIPGVELVSAIYDLKPGAIIRGTTLQGDFDGTLTIAGNPREYIRDGVYRMAAVDVVETTATESYIHSLYLPVKERTAVLENGTWTVAVSTTGTVVFPDGSQQAGASITIAALKALVAASTDFADFKSRIAAL